MAPNFHRVSKSVKNYEYSESEDSSSESESETLVLPVFEAIERREELNVMKQYFSECDINEVDELNNNCLHIAVNVIPYDLDVIKELLKHGVNINHPNWKMDTPLHTSAENPECDVDLIKVLLDNGANPNVENIYYDTPLHYYVMKCLREFSNGRNLEIIRFLLDNGANPNVPNFVHITPFLMAVHPPYCHFSALVGHIKYEADFSITRSNESLLDKPLLPSSIRSLDVIKLLLQYKPSLVKYIDREGRTPLHIAVFGGASVEIIKELVKKGADVNAADDDGNTPLHVMTLSSYSVIETLIRYGAKINARNNRRYTPLLESVNPRLNLINPTAITALIELGAKVNIGDLFSRPPLYFAMLNSSIPPGVVRMLLERRANPTKLNFSLLFFDKECCPPVYYCSNNQHKAMLYIQFLLLYLVNNVSRVSKPEKLIKFDLYGPALSMVFSKFRDNCISELYQMKQDKLNKDVSLYSYIREIISCKNSESKYPSSFTKELLFRILSNKYPNCRDLLGACIKRDSLIDYLSSLVIYTSVQDISNVKQSITLNYYSTLSLVKFLNKETLLHLVGAFSDNFNINKVRKLCTQASTQNSKPGKFGDKRKR